MVGIVVGAGVGTVDGSLVGLPAEYVGNNVGKTLGCGVVLPGK